MSAVLIVRPSSMGDVVYALAIVADVRRHRPELAIDWIAEPGFVPLVRMCPEVRNVIPFALRRWRRAPFARETWRNVREFRRELRAERYVAILDLQEQMKGALIARVAHGTTHGFDRASAREPLAAWFDDVHHRVDRRRHFIDRVRSLAAAALDYSLDAPPAWCLAPPATAPDMPDRPYVVAIHSASRDDKLWPDANWRELVANFERAGFTSVLPWGNAAEEARSRRIAEGFASAVVPRFLSLPDVAAMVKHAELAVGLDTGFTHLSGALGTPTVAIFVSTNRARHGVAATGVRARDLGDAGSPPGVEQVIAACGELGHSIPND